MPGPRIRGGRVRAVAAAALLILSAAGPEARSDEPLRFTNVAASADGAVLGLIGPTGLTYVTAISTNLLRWVTLGADAAPGGFAACEDESAPAAGARFYRARAVAPARAVITNYHGWSGSVVLSNAIAQAVIVPAVGRLMRFAFHGSENTLWENRALDGQPCQPDDGDWENFGGDKAWPAPQADWPAVTGRGWPPPKAFDSMASVAAVAGGEVWLESPIDPEYGIRVRRRIRLVPDEPVLIVTTTFEKLAGPVNRVAAWTVCQVNDPVRLYVPIPAGAEHPDGYHLLSGLPPPDLAVSNGMIAFSRDAAASHKLGFDAGTLLWMGATQALRMDVAVSASGEYADGGSRTEIYTNPGATAYVELELLGPLRDLAVGASLRRTVTYTLLRRGPGDADAEARRMLGL